MDSKDSKLSMMSPDIIERWKPNVLVIGPGGMKGFKYLGAVWAVDSAGLLKDLDILVV